MALILGLWCFDLCVTQISQENIEEEERGFISGMQTSTYQIFSVIIQLLVIMYSNPKDFIVLVTVSVCGIMLSALLYSYWYFKKNVTEWTSLASEVEDKVNKP